MRGSQEAVYRSVAKLTESRAALVRQRAGLFGFMAVMGPVLAILLLFLGNST
jgi:hypothetical protein